MADALAATLAHPDRKASVWTVKFSPDGTRLFAAGYPSGVVQVFDVASRKELRRIDTPAGLRGSAEYAQVTPDWKTLYVAVEKRTPKPIEKDGKKLYRIEFSGSIRVWDLGTGEEGAALTPAEDHAPAFARLTPDGKGLVSVERPSYDTDVQDVKDVTVVWDLATGAKRKLADGFSAPPFSPDGKVIALEGGRTKANDVRLLDAATLKELATLDAPDKDRSFAPAGFSPDGSVLAAALGGKKGAPREVWFRDGRTLEDRGRFATDGDPDGWGWGAGAFTPDGKHYVVLGVSGKIVVWDVAGKKVARTFDFAGNAWHLAVSADGKTLAVPWAPKPDAELADARNPDPADLPQPRVTLYDLAGDAPPRTLVAPPGYAGGIAFSPDGKLLALGTSGGVRLFDLSK